MTRYITVVFQNVDGDGLPTMIGDVVLTVETPFDKGPMLARFAKSGHDGFWSPDRNPRMAASWRTKARADEKPGGQEFEVVKRLRTKAHGSSDQPPTPRRDVCELVLDLRPGRETDQPLLSLVWAHAVNSAWAPLWKRTSFRKERRALWWDWYHTVSRQLAASRRAGWVPVVFVDGNRMGRWAFPGTRVAWKHGPDRILVPKDGSVRVVNVEMGPRTGDGRVTHPSVRVTLAVD